MRILLFLSLLLPLWTGLRAQSPQQMFWQLNQCQLPLNKIPLKASGAYSLRKLNCAYAGPAIQVRRSSDGSLLQIGFNSRGDLDTTALKTFAGSGNASVVTWFDQSGYGRHATQTTVANQPLVIQAGSLHIATGRRPALLFSGDQWLDCNTDVQLMTNSGKEATVAMMVKANATNHFSFGVHNVAAGSDRWAAHINWPDHLLYFDPGAIDGTGGSRVMVNNSSNEGKMQQYALLRTATSSEIRIGGTSAAINTAVSATNRCTHSANFWIGAANNYPGKLTGSMSEVIIYPDALNASQLTLLENNQLNYWIRP